MEVMVTTAVVTTVATSRSNTSGNNITHTMDRPIALLVSKNKHEGAVSEMQSLSNQKRLLYTSKLDI